MYYYHFTCLTQSIHNMVLYHNNYVCVSLLHIAGLTVDNIRKALHGICWHKVGGMLFIPNSKLREIEGEYRSDEEREVAVIRYWILRDPFASWRRIIQQLENWEKHDHAITLYHYSEELTGMMGAQPYTSCIPITCTRVNVPCIAGNLYWTNILPILATFLHITIFAN